MDYHAKKKELRNQLVASKRYQISAASKAAKQDLSDDAAGVYIVRQEDSIVYVGETGCLKKRLHDLLDSRNHSFRRSIGSKLFIEEEGYKPASARSKFPDPIEDRLNKYIEEKLTISFLEVPFGRKEVEEVIVEEMDKAISYNKRSKRTSRKIQLIQ